MKDKPTIFEKALKARQQTVNLKKRELIELLKKEFLVTITSAETTNNIDKLANSLDNNHLIFYMLYHDSPDLDDNSIELLTSADICRLELFMVNTITKELGFPEYRITILDDLKVAINLLDASETYALVSENCILEAESE